MEANTSAKQTATLPIVRFEELSNKDDHEIKKMVDAARTVGMFYLDLRGMNTGRIFEDMPTIFRTAETFFNLPLDSIEKVQSAREGVERGYHRGKGFEYYEIPRNDFELGKWVLPKTFEPYRGLITRTIEIFNSAVQTILAELCHAASIVIPEISDDPTMPSDTALKIVFKPPIHDAGTVIHPWHTDFGLLTLLWYDEETTQIPVYAEDGSQTEDWKVIPVVEGCVLVNVANHLADKSGQYLHSTTHRVVAPPGAKRVRNGIIYLLRPYLE